jgi:hypothetical protein
LKSVGLLTLHVDSIRVLGGEFVATPTSSVVLPAGDSLYVSITFSPTSVGAQSGYLVAYSDATTSPDSVHLVGTGVQSGFSGVPNPLSFGNVSVGATATDTITVTNTGTATLAIDSVRTRGGEFAVTPSGATNVAPGNSAKFAVAFGPSSIGPQNGDVVFYGNAPQSPDSIGVTGSGVSATVMVSVSIASGWNLISNPVSNPIPGDSVRQLYPSSVSAYAFEFSGGYVQRFRLLNGKGYWGKFPGALSNPITGTARMHDSISVVAGWNIVGTISHPVETSAIIEVPPGLRASQWFGYSSGYTPVTQLVPGKAYWIKASTAGWFVLPDLPLSGPSTSRVSGIKVTDMLNSMTITDSRGGSQTLYFGADANNEIPVAFFSMPPVPPTGAFDARFETSHGGSMVRTHAASVQDALEFPVTIHSDDYPLTVSWKVSPGDMTYALSDGSGGRTFASKVMMGEGSIKITSSAVSTLSVKLMGERELPTDFALQQNYPNPFNPSTTITFAVPVQSRVDAEIYNLLGQRVSTLVREELPAGYHVVEWSGTGSEGQQLGSGTYFLKFSATGANGKKFNEARKLLILR